MKTPQKQTKISSFFKPLVYSYIRIDKKNTPTRSDIRNSEPTPKLELKLTKKRIVQLDKPSRSKRLALKKTNEDQTSELDMDSIREKSSVLSQDPLTIMSQRTRKPLGKPSDLINSEILSANDSTDPLNKDVASQVKPVAISDSDDDLFNENPAYDLFKTSNRTETLKTKHSTVERMKTVDSILAKRLIIETNHKNYENFEIQDSESEELSPTSKEKVQNRIISKESRVNSILQETLSSVQVHFNAITGEFSSFGTNNKEIIKLLEKTDDFPIIFNVKHFIDQLSNARATKTLLNQLLNSDLNDQNLFLIYSFLKKLELNCLNEIESQVNRLIKPNNQPSELVNRRKIVWLLDLLSKNPSNKQDFIYNCSCLLLDAGFDDFNWSIVESMVKVAESTTIDFIFKVSTRVFSTINDFCSSVIEEAVLVERICHKLDYAFESSKLRLFQRFIAGHFLYQSVLKIEWSLEINGSVNEIPKNNILLVKNILLSTEIKSFGQWIHFIPLMHYSLTGKEFVGYYKKEIEEIDGLIRQFYAKIADDRTLGLERTRCKDQLLQLSAWLRIATGYLKKFKNEAYQSTIDDFYRN